MNALYKNILEKPRENFPRLVYADWLEENEDFERAKVIRTMIEWPKCFVGDCGHYCVFKGIYDQPSCPKDVATAMEWIRQNKEFGQSILGSYLVMTKYEGVVIELDRGFPGIVRCSMRQWMGVKCGVCNGTGRMSIITAQDMSTSMCQGCAGAGTVKDVGRRLCEKWPIVRVYTDKKPDTFNRWWLNPSDIESLAESNIPIQITRFMKMKRVSPIAYRTDSFDSVEDADRYLSDAMIAYAKEQVEKTKESS